MHRQVLAVWLAMLCCAAGAHAEDCTVAKAPVCSIDGVTFMNECIARLQGVEIAAHAPCSPKASAAFANPPAASLDVADGALPSISAAALGRFAAQGFVMTGVARRANFRPSMKMRAAADVAKDAQVVPTAADLAATRLTSDGFLYHAAGEAAAASLAAASEAPAGSSSASAPATAPQHFDAAAAEAAMSEAAAAANAIVDAASAASSGNRKLKYVVGADNRVELTSAPGWPNTAAGHLTFTGGWCSGAMISARSVLTAAHCVYSRSAWAWQANVQFSAARYKSGSVVDTKPYGTANWAHITTYAAWTSAATSSPWPYDIAVVQLADATLGSRTGALGYAWNAVGFAGTITTTGYPGDKANAPSLWTTSCSVTDFPGTDATFLHGCDIYNGQSGSAMWDTSLRVRAVVSWHSCSSCCTSACASCCGTVTNGGCGINEMHYNSITSWK